MAAKPKPLRKQLLPSEEPGSNTGAGGDRQRIESYGAGGFRVSGVRHSGSILILPDATTAWAVNNPEALSVDSLSPVLAAEPPVEILLFGCGPRLIPVEPIVRLQLREAGIVIEPMDTGAACRTYSLLVAEDRRIAAALIAVD